MNVPSGKPFLITLILCFSTMFMGFIYTCLLLIIVLASQAHHVSPFTLWDSAQLRSPLKRKEMKGWWLTQAESAHGGGAGITFPRLCYHRGSWVSAWLWHHRVWVRVMGAHGASQVILIYNFSFFSLPFPSITKQETMTRCESLLWPINYYRSFYKFSVWNHDTKFL